MSATSKPRKKILFVDDSADFLAVFSQAMEVTSKGEWEVFTSHNAAQALEILERGPINLAVIDSQMPLVDGLQLIRLLGRKYPNLPKAILTGFPNESDRQACLSSGADLYLHKPTKSDEMQTIFMTLNELARVDTDEVGFQGTVRRVGLHDILQMECLGRNSGILEIFNNDIRGEIFIRTGSIIHSQTQTLSGLEAFYHLFSISGGGFKLKAFIEPPAVTISKSWEFLLMEASRRRDEGNTSEGEVEETIMESHEAAPEVPDLPLVLPKVKIPKEKKGPVQIQEMAVFASDGQVLYEWQCTDIELRKRLLEFVSGQSKQIAQGLDLGRFDLVEIHSAAHQTVAQIQDDTGIYLEVSNAVVVAGTTH
ncbi:MAG: Response regulator receiver protein [Verrucomicrobiales bacterium]|nr:Response regulator receiver protein [Verrucomicrobiales bacterium]